ncbi:hypothetical protein DFJ43DRAFT_1150625 [Lentinula guzmanii]|uniref:Uncharacterized protein n=1 Tax=Lentinula guzmanii TaxID=2804957 RepID=A0AA38JP85_9AGAR|nr:hypothetical protein DFJ43DRAFT_1150625 [Lentinula guzmanii]
MAVGASSSDTKEAASQKQSLHSAFQDFQAEVARETAKNMITTPTSRASPSIEEDSLESLLVPGAQGRLQFGDPKKRNKHTTRALFTVTNVSDAACRLQSKIQTISPLHTPIEEIQDTLRAVEDGSEALHYQIDSVTRPAIAEEVKEARAILESLDQVVCAWRLEYPDSSPVKIDNRKYFLDPGEGKSTPTILAYCIALVTRVFNSTAQGGGSLILKLLKLFGFTFATLGGRDLNSEQEAALAGIPESIETLEKKFNLDIKCIPYAICPSCSFTHPPTYPNNASRPVYPSVCLERRAPLEEPCGASLLAHGKPLKKYEYYPFFDWFGRFLAQPGIEEYGNKFCDTISSHQSIPVDKIDQTDGRFVHEFRDKDGQLFVADRGNEGRWFFVLNSDFFNVEGNRIRGKKSSTGMIAMSCLNLPLEIRNDNAFLYIPGIIQGPHEPDAKDAEHRHFLKPLVDDLLKGYTRGVRPFSTFLTRKSDTPYSHVSHVAVALASMDFKAIRPFCGLLDVTSHHFCFLCDCWHVAHLGRTDYENWKPLDDERLRKSAEMWRDAMLKDRKAIERLYEKAPETLSKKKVLYGRIHKQKWNAILFVCDNLATFPDHRCPQFQSSLKILKCNVSKEHLTNLLIDWRTNSIQETQVFVWPYFTPIDKPPPVTSWAPTYPLGGFGDTSANTRRLTPGERTEILEDLGKSMNYSSASHVGGIHRVLQQPLAQGEQEIELRKTLGSFPGISLAYVCTDIEQLPDGKFSKFDMVERLIKWRMTKPLEQLKSTPIDSPALLRRVQQAVSEVVTPAWVTNPPPNVGLYEAGVLKADNWRTLFAIHVPLATLSLWKEASPLAAANACDMASVMDTVMHLVCASLVMTKRKLSMSRREQFRHLLRLHIMGLKQNFPGWIFPSHHLAFHIFEFMDLFSGVRHWWLFPFEKMIGKLQRIPTNHKPGEFEHTLQHSFCGGAFFRQWMMRPNAPPILQYCQKLIDKAYNYDHRPVLHDDAAATTSELIESNFAHPISKKTIASAPELTKLLGLDPFESFTRIPATKGDYTIPIEGALGNSYICFRPEGNYQPGQEWVAAQIQHIFRRHKNSPIQFAIHRSQSPRVTVTDPFCDFWANGFEAKLFSSKFSHTLEIIDMKQVAAHSARWTITDDLVIAVNLCSVS